MAQVRSITSEALEAQIRDLLPSQQGFTEDLQASNVITPIIDLTRAAEGSTISQRLQESYAYGSNTTFEQNNGTSSISLTPGFYRFTGVSVIKDQQGQNFIAINNGLGDKKVWQHSVISAALTTMTTVPFDEVFFLRAGDSITLGQFISGS